MHNDANMEAKSSSGKSARCKDHDDARKKYQTNESELRVE